MSPLEFAIAVMTYCQTFDASVTSWGRTKLHNEAVGGVSNSLHLVWLAADVVYDAERGEEKRKITAARLGLLLSVHKTYDHLQPLTRR